MPKSRTSQNGNALFLILIAVALFAALSYAITSSSRDSGSISKEQASLDAAQIATYFSSIQHAIQTLVLTGCSDQQISLATDNYVRADYPSPIIPVGSNPYAPTDGSCSVFDPAGGNVPPVILKAALGGPRPPVNGGLGAMKQGNPVFQVASWSGDGSSAQDIYGIMPFVKSDVCAAFNKAYNISSPPSVGQPDIADWFYKGDYTVGGTISVTSSESQAFCGVDSAGDYDIVFVVYQR